MQKMCRLADTVRVIIVERPRDGVTIEEVAEAIDRDLSGALQDGVTSVRANQVRTTGA